MKRYYIRLDIETEEEFDTKDVWSWPFAVKVEIKDPTTVVVDCQIGKIDDV